MIIHIRRSDEVNITYCDLLTAYEDEITEAPIKVGKSDLAVFDDIESPAGTHCHACHIAYMNVHVPSHR